VYSGYAKQADKYTFSDIVQLFEDGKVERFTVTQKGVLILQERQYDENGEIKTNDTVYIVAADGTKTEAVVTAIEMFNKVLDEAQAGDNVGLLVPSVEKTAVARGNALIKADSDYKITTTVIGTLTLLSKEEGGLSNKIESGYQAQFYYASHDETGTITFSAESLEPGATLEDVKVVLKEKLPRFLGQTFEIKISGRKIGTFTVTEFKSLSTRPAVTPST
jgi:elongation factor Tu